MDRVYAGVGLAAWGLEQSYDDSVGETRSGLPDPSTRRSGWANAFPLDSHHQHARPEPTRWYGRPACITRDILYTTPWHPASNALMFGTIAHRNKKGSIPVAALVSLNDLERLNRLGAEREADFAAFDEVGQAFAHQSSDQIERVAVDALTEVSTG